MANKNKYVDFVSDEDFLKCVKWVCEAYPTDSEEIDMKKLQKNTIDPFKLIFDIINGELQTDEWISSERIRQNDKTINNRIGEFHQKLLGKVNGWVDLGVGDDSKVDLMKSDKSIFIELKNKFNTMNSDSTDKCRDKLEMAVRNNPKVKAYWAFLVSKNGDSGDIIWKKGGKSDERIRKVWGSKVYELVTGDPKALEKTWKALALAIKDLRKSEFSINEIEMTKLLEFFNYAFH